MFLGYISNHQYTNFFRVLKTKKNIFTNDAILEAANIVSRVSTSFLLTKLSNKSIALLYSLASILFFSSSIMYIFCLYNIAFNHDFLFYFSWFINRTAGGVLAGVRDFIIYQALIYKTFNISLIKTMKGVGAELSIIQIFFVKDLTASAIFLFFFALVNLTTSIQFTYTVFKNNSVIDIEIKEGGKIKTEKATPKVHPLTLKSCVASIVIPFLLSMASISDQFIIKQGFYAQFILLTGQIVFGYLYSKFIKNRIYGLLVLPIIYFLLYTVHMFYIPFGRELAYLMSGLALVLKNIIYILIPLNVANYNPLYQIMSLLSETTAGIIMNWCYDNIYKDCAWELIYLMGTSLFSVVSSFIAIKFFKKK